MPLDIGARVTATRTLGMGRVPEGTPGRVVRAGFFGRYDVDFGKGRVLRDVNRDVLTPAGGGPWWARGRNRQPGRS